MPVAWVVAIVEAYAKAAAAQVEARYEPLPACLSIDEASARGQFFGPPAIVARGDAPQALAQSTHRVQGEVRTGGQDHFYLETQASWVHIDSEGLVQVTASTQHPTETQVVVARVLGIPAHRVVCRCLRMGGGFGGKETQANAFAAVAALAALRTGRPGLLHTHGYKAGILGRAGARVLGIPVVSQARESQIQLALERVRARTMAMQKSDELPETSHILFQQMKELGEPVEQLTIGIVVHEEDNVIEISATLHGGMLKKIYRHSINEPYMMSKVYKAWKTQQKTLVVELKGDELNAYNKYRNELTKSEMFPTNLDDEQRRIVYAAFFSRGMLALAANETCPPQSLELLERFASVFDLTYTRFLDLQKAEAQAREASPPERGRSLTWSTSLLALEVFDRQSRSLVPLRTFTTHRPSHRRSTGLDSMRS